MPTCECGSSHRDGDLLCPMCRAWPAAASGSRLPEIGDLLDSIGVTALAADLEPASPQVGPCLPAPA